MYAPAVNSATVTYIPHRDSVNSLDILNYDEDGQQIIDGELVPKTYNSYYENQVITAYYKKPETAGDAIAV